jgi:hypothetical protein
MDVDASQRRPDGGRRGGDPLQRRRRTRARGAEIDHRRVMEKPTDLYTIQEPDVPADSNVFHLSTNVFQLNAIRSYAHGLASARPLAAPWPRQVVWHDLPPPTKI